MSIKFYLEHIINTLILYQYPFSKEWDRRLNEIIAEGEITELTEYTVTFLHKEKKIDIWIANRFCAYGMIHRVNGDLVPKELQCRPSAKTMLKLDSITCNEQRKIKDKVISNFRKKHHF